MPGRRSRPSSPFNTTTGSSPRYPKRTNTGATTMTTTTTTTTTAKLDTCHDFLERAVDEPREAVDDKATLASTTTTESSSRKRKRNKKASKATQSDGFESEDDHHHAEEPPKKKLAIEEKKTNTNSTPTKKQPPLASTTTTTRIPRTPPPSLMATPVTDQKEQVMTTPPHIGFVLPLPPTWPQQANTDEEQSSLAKKLPPKPTAKTVLLLEKELTAKTVLFPEKEAETRRVDNLAKPVPRVDETVLLETTEKEPTTTPNNYPILHTILVYLSWTYVLGMICWSAHRRNLLLPVCSLPPATCFRTNVHTRIPYPASCTLGKQQPCPKHGLCFGGKVHDCRFGGSNNHGEYYFEYSPMTQQCQLTQSVNATVTQLVERVEHWTMVHACGGGAGDDDARSGIPDPVWLEPDKERPLFVLKDIITKQQQQQQHDDILSLVRLVTQHDATTNLVLTEMPQPEMTTTKSTTSTTSNRWFKATGKGDVTAEVEVVPPPGTPLIGLNDTLSWRQWLPLAVQCRANGMILSSGTARTSPLEERDTKADPTNNNNGTKTNLNNTNKRGRIVRQLLAAARDSSGLAVFGNSEKTVGNIRSVFSVIRKAILSFVQGIRNTTATAISNMTAPAADTNTSLATTTKRRQRPPPLNRTVGMRPKKPDATQLQQPQLSFTDWIYFWISMIGLAAVVIVHRQQRQWERRRKMVPQIAQLREMALDCLLFATNGGYVTTQLRDEVVDAAVFSSSMNHHDDDDDDTRRKEHLKTTIWPKVLEQLHDNLHVVEYTVVSKTTGREQRVLKWNEEKHGVSAREGKKPKKPKKVTILE